MVVDTLENLEKYASLNPLFAQAIEFLKSHDLQAMEIGKTELKGKDLLVNIAQTKPKTKEEAKLETHNEFIDIQIPLSGTEVMGYTAAKDCTYRIYRDTRFSADKTPYKIHFGGYINAKGKKSDHCGYYVHLQPDGSMLAGGSLCLPPNVLKAVRQAIYDNVEEYISIVEDPEFKKYFPVVGEDFMKTAPKGFPKDFKYIDYLKCRQFVCSYLVPDDFFTRADVMEQIEKAFRQFKRFADFINYTIDDFE